MGRRIIIGDIHGCFHTLKTLLELKVKITPEDKIILVGDLIDRGPRSKEVLDLIMNLSWQGYQIFSIKGNHEEMCLNATEHDSFLQVWFANGAEATLRSFEIPDNLIFSSEAAKLIPDEYIQFIRKLPYYYDLGDYIVVHAGLNFEKDNIFEDVHAMLWSRRIEYKANKIGNRTIIHGHTPMPFVSIKQHLGLQGINILNIDAGCVYKELPGYGILAALDLDNKELYFQDNVD